MSNRTLVRQLVAIATLSAGLSACCFAVGRTAPSPEARFHQAPTETLAQATQPVAPTASATSPSNSQQSVRTPVPSRSPSPFSEKVTHTADAFFPVGSASLTPESRAKLDDLVRRLAEINLEVIVAVGHTDSVGSDVVNQKLAVLRAEAVKSYLVSKGIERNRIYTHGSGEKQPVADNKTAEGRAMNRRVEIEVVGTRARSDNQTVVYNLEITPQNRRRDSVVDAPVLAHGVRTTLVFGIGAQKANSVLGDRAPNPSLLQSDVDVPLTVIFACTPCDPQEDTAKSLVYRAATREAGPVEFKFVPRLINSKPGETRGGTLEFSIVDDRNGRTYDRIVVDVAIADRPDPPKTVQASASAVKRPPPAPLASLNHWADAVLVVGEDGPSGVTVQVRPMKPDVDQTLRALVIDSTGHWRSFKTGKLGQDELAALSLPTNTSLARLLLQGDLGKGLSNATGTDLTIDRSAQESLLLSPSKSQQVSDLIAQYGRLLYYVLFVGGEDGQILSDVVGKLESLAAARPPERPFRLLIQTDRLLLPWQILHPTGPVDANAFWGMRFSMAVERVETGVRFPPTKPESGPGQSRKVVFARYGGASDKSIPLAQQQISQLAQLPIADLSVVASSKDLLDNALTKDRYSVSALLAFLHAGSGQELVTDGQTTYVQHTADGPLLRFGDKDVVTSIALLALLSKVPVADQFKRYLEGAPLVILNACETGPSVTNLPHVTLVNAMLRLGAQGVLVTEVPVWMSLGHEVATRLYARLGRGEFVSDALTAVRREIYVDKLNPLGLLYMYHGDPTAVLRR